MPVPTALALAEIARREGNGPEMRIALSDVPDDLRDSTWHKLVRIRDSATLAVMGG